MVLIQNLVFNNIARLLCGSGLTLRDFPSILYLILYGFISLIPLPKAFSCFSVSCSPPAFIPSLISIFHCCILLHSILQTLSPEAKKGKICYFSLFLSVCLSVCVSFSWFQGNQGNLNNTIPVNPHCKCKLQKCKNPDFWPQDVILAGNTIFEPKIYFILTLLTKSPRHMSTLPSTVPVFSQKPL